MKGMVSTARIAKFNPPWTKPTFWTTMTIHWGSEKAKKRSISASKARNSQRKGLGIHKHLSGQKSSRQIQDEKEIELGRPVLIGEVFTRTHTKPDGTFVDLKAQNIAETYEKNLQAKLSELRADNSENSDGGLESRQLTQDEYNDLFLQSTTTDKRGHAYGLGSLEETVNGKRKRRSSFSSFVAMEEQLAAAHRKIEEQAVDNARQNEEVTRREAELSRIVAEQQNEIKDLQLAMRYFSQIDPKFNDL